MRIHVLCFVAFSLALPETLSCTPPPANAPGNSIETDAALTADGGPRSDSGVLTDSGQPLDAGPSNDAGQPTDAGNPLASIPRDQAWHFVPFDNAYCANGTTTGIGVNFTNASDDVLIFLGAGGACWDQQTCNDSCAINLNTGYDETHGNPSWSTFGSNQAKTIFDRTDPQNGLANFNYVFVFYCTGDTHAGSRINPGYTVKGPDGGPQPVHHLGFQNLEHYLQALRGTFRPQRVALFGASAGGFGVYLDYDLVARAFPVPVYMLDDSGPYFQNPYWPPDSGIKMAEAWNVLPAIPSGCTECLSTNPDGGLAALAPYLSAAYPNGRMALLTSMEDGEISQRYTMDGGHYAAALNALAADVLDPAPNWRVFYMAGNNHTAIQGHIAGDSACGLGITQVTGLDCGQTLQQFVNDEVGAPLASWQSSTPPAGATGVITTWGNHWYCAMDQ